MIEVYDDLFETFKEYITNNSIYSPRVVKNNTNTSTYFPIITLSQSNYTNTYNTTINKVDKFDQYYFSINVYTKNTVIEKNKISSQVINDELTNLTLAFFESNNFYISGCSYTFNLDSDITRRRISVQCQIGNRGQITRR